MRSEEIAAIRAGIFVTAGFAALIGLLFALGQRSRFFEDYYTLYARFRNVQGLSVDAPVRLAGVLVGKVKSVQIPIGLDRTDVLVELEIARFCQEKIREDSRASIRTLGALGDKYVEISIGTVSRRMLQPLDELRTVEPLDFYAAADEARTALARVTSLLKTAESVLSQFEASACLTHLSNISKSLSHIMQGIEVGPGALHTVLFDPNFNKALEDAEKIIADMREMVAQLRDKNMGIGALLQGEEIPQTLREIRTASEALRKIVTEIKDGQGLLHSLIFEPKESNALLEFAEATRNLSRIVERVEKGEGTLGLLINDPGLWEDLRRLLSGAERSAVLRHLIKKSLEEAEKPVR